MSPLPYPTLASAEPSSPFSPCFPSVSPPRAHAVEASGCMSFKGWMSPLEINAEKSSNGSVRNAVVAQRCNALGSFRTASM